MGISFWQIILVVILFLLLFGRGKIPALMSDLATGIKSFKTGLKEDEHLQTLDSDTEIKVAETEKTSIGKNNHV